MNAALNTDAVADAKLIALARAEMYSGLSRLLASPEQATAKAWLDHVAIVERLLIADEALSMEGSRIAELFALSQAANLEHSAEDIAALVGASYGALFEVGDVGVVCPSCEERHINGLFANSSSALRRLGNNNERNLVD